MSQAMINLITKETTKESVREAYKTYPDTQPQGFEQYHASTVEPMFCEVPDGSKVLDVGCNSGAFMQLLRDTKGCDVVGVDVSETALDLARQKGLNVLNVSAEELPFEDAIFDVVIMREVLVHIHEPVKALKEIRRVLKPSGFLLGSAPHANIEKHLWDDKAPHHKYYNEDTLIEHLDQAFELTHLKVLTGAQFSLGLAMSHMSDVSAELLWKSGNKDTPVWEHALTSDKETLRVWMGPTQQPGDVYYRMIGFAAKMRRLKGVEVGFENFNWTANESCSEWQRKMLLGVDGNPISSVAMDQFEKCLKVTDPWVFQVTYYHEVLALFELLKTLYPSKRLITECDDWIFDLPAYNVASHPYKPNSEKEQIAWGQFEVSDAIIVSTNFLKEQLLTLFPEKPIHVIPNAIDFDIWDNVKGDGLFPEKKEGVVRIGFTGCGNHGGDLELVKPVLLALLDEFPNLEVLIPGEFDCFKDVKHDRFIIPRDRNGNSRWVSIIEYPAMVKGWDLDIGIAPLRDNMFNRAKSNLRWLEYSAMQIPTVASTVRPFTESITHGKDGYLCSNMKAWYDSLKYLIESEVARNTIGDAAYNTVKDKFNMTKVAEGYANLLKEIRNGR